MPENLSPFLIFLYFIMFLEDLENLAEVVGMFPPHIFNSKIINDKENWMVSQVCFHSPGVVADS